MDKEINFKIGNLGGGIGDSLQITPIFKYFKNATIEIKNNDKGRFIAPIYKNLAEIAFKDDPFTQEQSFSEFGDISKTDRLRNGALNYLYIYGIENKVSPIPWVTLEKEELDWAIDFLHNYQKPLSIICTMSAVQSGNGQLYRFMDLAKWQEIINFYSSLGYTPIQFGHFKDLTNLDNLIPKLGLTVRQMAACMKIIGKTITLDTGPYHLSLAIGAKTKCLVPTFGWGVDYYFPNWGYSPDMFGGKNLVEYHLFDSYHTVMHDNWNF